MADTLQALLEKLQLKIRELTAQNRQLTVRNSELTAENAQLRQEAEEAEQERDRAMLDAEYLAVSHKLADSPDTLVSTRRHIAGLIRNIDRCLEMLKE